MLLNFKGALFKSQCLSTKYWIHHCIPRVVTFGLTMFVWSSLFILIHFLCSLPDCCDGSDEVPLRASSSQSLCHDTCHHDGKIWRAEQKRLRIEFRKGLEEAAALSKMGVKIQYQWKTEKEELTDKKIPKLRQEIELLKSM